MPARLAFEWQILVTYFMVLFELTEHFSAGDLVFQEADFKEFFAEVKAILDGGKMTSEEIMELKAILKKYENKQGKKTFSFINKLASFIID